VPTQREKYDAGNDCYETCDHHETPMRFLRFGR
jgi:hypothetical protein